jgi:hypothetical protein
MGAIWRDRLSNEVMAISKLEPGGLSRPDLAVVDDEARTGAARWAARPGWGKEMSGRFSTLTGSPGSGQEGRSQQKPPQSKGLLSIRAKKV